MGMSHDAEDSEQKNRGRACGFPSAGIRWKLAARRHKLLLSLCAHLRGVETAYWNHFDETGRLNAPRSEVKVVPSICDEGRLRAGNPRSDQARRSAHCAAAECTSHLARGAP